MLQRFGLWLRDYYSKPRNVKHIVEDITDNETDNEGIKSETKNTLLIYFLIAQVSNLC